MQGLIKRHFLFFSCEVSNFKTKKSMIKKIISGGQTGADQAALDTAIKLDIPHGGWLPKGRLTEAGPLPEKYQLKEMVSSSYLKRTEQNVIDSDGTLIFSHGELIGGSKLTQELAEKHSRPFLHVDLNQTTSFDAAQDINSWIRKNGIETLNIAGPRASSDPNIYQAVAGILEALFYLNLMRITHYLLQQMNLLQLKGHYHS